MSEPLRLVTFRLGEAAFPAVWDGDAVVRIPGAPSGEDGLLHVIAGWRRWEPVARGARDDRRAPRIPAQQGRILTPLAYPGKLLIAGSNYREHVREMNRRRGKPEDTFPNEPYLLSLPTRHAIVGSGDPIVVPAWAENIDWEIELAVVIGKEAARVSPAAALDCVFGYTIMNDVTARKALSRTDVSFQHDFLSGKGLDTFCPIGPCVVPKEDLPFPVELRLSVNGELMQHSSTADFVFDVATTVAYASERTTLDPGDVISTGTPGGVGAGRGRFLHDGDRMVGAIGGIGELENTVTFRAAPVAR